MTGNSMSGSWIPENLPEDVLHGFSRAGLHALKGHIHPIPLGRGFHLSLMATWPGLTFSEALTRAKEAGVWKESGRTFPPITVADHVKEFHILHDGTTRVISFTDEELAARDGDPDARNAPGGFLLPIRRTQ